jgi:hypothetical protein
MRYVKKYDSFKKEESTNEEFLGALYNAAKGALKNFFGNIMAPFKTLKDDFKKGMKREDIKKKIIEAMDSVLKTSIKSINECNDKVEIQSMVDGFEKQILDEMATFDKEIKSVKESNIINEGKVQDALIGARVAFGVIKQNYDTLKAEYDKKFLAAKDIANHRKESITFITNIVNEFKTKVNNPEFFKKAEEEYRKANQIAASTVTDYKIGEELIYLRKNQQKTAWDALTDEQKKAPTTDEVAKKIVNVKKVDKIEGDKFTFTGKDGKQIVKTSAEIVGKAEVAVEGEDEKKLQADLGELKKVPEQMKRVAKFVDFIKTKADKLPEVDKLLSGEEAATEA